MEKIERIQCGNVNCYIISNGENAVLVDTCSLKYRDKILKACRRYHMRLLVLTHGHMDHIQNAAYLSEELKIPAAMHQADAGLIENNLSQDLSADTFLGKIVLEVSVKSLRKITAAPFVPSVYLSEADTLDEYGIQAKILSVPGHTDGSIAVDVGEKDLIVGDALMNMVTPSVSLLYHDRAGMIKSARRIAMLGERTIHFGHGRPASNRQWVKN